MIQWFRRLKEFTKAGKGCVVTAVLSTPVQVITAVWMHTMLAVYI